MSGVVETCVGSIVRPYGEFTCGRSATWHIRGGSDELRMGYYVPIGPGCHVCSHHLAQVVREFAAKHGSVIVTEARS